MDKLLPLIRNERGSTEISLAIGSRIAQMRSEKRSATEIRDFLDRLTQELKQESSNHQYILALDVVAGLRNKY